MKKVLLLACVVMLFVACEKEEEPCAVAKISAQYLSGAIATSLQCTEADLLYKDIVKKTIKVCDIGRGEKTLMSSFAMFCPVFSASLLEILKVNDAVTKYGCQLEVIQKILANPNSLCQIIGL